MTLSDAYAQLRELVSAAEDDINKAAGGNKAAGTRVRKKMQDIKNHAHDMRKLVLESRGDDETPTKPTTPTTPTTPAKS